VTDLATMEQRIANTLSRDRILAGLSSAFAGLAALPCGLGLFGMMNFHVATRQRELGIRLVLGAERRSIQWNVVREAVLVIVVGAPVGLAAYLASSRVVGSFLFELSPTDVPTVAAAACMLVLVALAASFVPARRATHLDPAVILRREQTGDLEVGGEGGDSSSFAAVRREAFLPPLRRDFIPRRSHRAAACA
jgi:ABC-type antimicrobial peptide transport system permease subunit